MPGKKTTVDDDSEIDAPREPLPWKQDNKSLGGREGEIPAV